MPPKANPSQTQTAIQTVIIKQEAPKKKRRVRRKRASAKKATVSPLEQYRATIAPVLSFQQPPSMGNEYRQLMETLNTIQTVQRVKADQAEQAPTPTPKENVSQRLQRYAQGFGDILATVGDVAQTVEQGVNVAQGVQGVVKTLREVKISPSQFQLQEQQQLFDNVPSAPIPEYTPPSFPSTKPKLISGTAIPEENIGAIREARLKVVEPPKPPKPSIYQMNKIIDRNKDAIMRTRGEITRVRALKQDDKLAYLKANKYI